MRQPKMNLEDYDKGALRLQEAINQMGYASLRPGQKSPIDCIMYQRDTICILPTGAGKSAIFALPTIAMEWKTIVFSPLIALMRDQVQSMNRAGIRTGCINSNQTEMQNYSILREWSEGQLQMLYVAPERLSNPQFKQALVAVRPDFVVLDEAHTLSEWSDNFRPAYQRCGEFIEEYNPKVVAAFTATATNQVIADVERVLKITDACICRYYPPRENLHLSSEVLTTNDDLYPSILKQVRRVKGSCIVYCQTVKEVSKLTEYLSQSGESVTFYHGQIQETNLKDMNQDEFMSGRARICVATNAFGMGIDKPDIEGVIHAGPPGSVEAVTQETGRAARDGRDAVCHMFMTPSGRWMQEFFWNTSNPDGHTVRDVYNYLKRISGTDGVAYITGKDLCEAVESPSAEGALNYLQACGCVERFDSGIKLYTITLKSPDPESIKATHKKVYDLVQEGGTAAGVSDEGYPVYQIDMAWLVSKLSVLASTVQAKINQLKKDGHIDFIPPFRGKATRLISPPTQEDIDRADQKRSVEWKKIADVREYVETPDDEKQDFLQNYFMIDRNAIS